MRLFFLSAFICVHLRLIALPLWFEPNLGQAHPSVQFLARSSNGYVYFGPNHMAVGDLRVELFGANATSQTELEQPLGGISSYFIGRSEKDWHTGIPHYGRVRYKDVYAGIDLVYYGNQGNVEYDFELKPGADPNQIKLAYTKPVRIDSNGDLLVTGLRQKRPKVFQNGHEVACDYLIRARNHVQLALAGYDHSQALTVDPVLEFSTYLGGPGEDWVGGIKADAKGFVYVAGGSQSPQSPTLDPFRQPSTVSEAPFVLKFAGDGSRVIYYAVLGANGWDGATGIAVDASGSAVIAGTTRSTNFPLKNPVQSEFKDIWDSAFISKLSSDGRALVFSTYLGGGNREESLAGVALDSQGNAYFGGYTSSNDFPVKNAAQPRSGGGSDCFVAKMSPAGALLFATYLGGNKLDTCHGIAVDAHDNPLIVGASLSDDYPIKNAVQATRNPNPSGTSAILTKLTPDGEIVFSTFLGDDAKTWGKGIAFDVAGNIYVGGVVSDQKLRTSANVLQSSSGGGDDAFIMKLNSSASKVLYSSYIGGSSSDAAYDIAVDGSGSMYLFGYTASPDFPVKNSLQPFRGGGVLMADFFVMKLAPSGNSLIYSTFLGGSGNELPGRMTLDGAGNIYVGGQTNSMNFPTRNAYQSEPGGSFDGVLAKLSDNTAITPSPLTATPARLIFRYVQGQNKPPSQTVAISAASAVAFAIATSDPWLSVTAPSLATPATLTVSIVPAGLAPGIYTGTIQLVPQSDTPRTVDVSLNVLAPAPVLTAVEPAFLPIGSDATTITIHGSGFTNDSVVQVNGVPFTPVTFIDANTLRILLPDGYFKIEFNHTIAVKNPTSDLSNVISVAVGKPAPQFTAAGVVNAASFAGGPVAAGEIVTIFGTNLDQNVAFDGIPATLVYFSSIQVSVTVPYAVAGQTRTELRVGKAGGSSLPLTLDVSPSAPGIFAAVPAGDKVLVLYATGCGALTKDDLPRCALPVSITVKGEPSDVLYAGIAPGLVEGANQINVKLPDDITSGPLTIVLKAGDASSKPFMWTMP